MLNENFNQELYSLYKSSELDKKLPQFNYKIYDGSSEYIPEVGEICQIKIEERTCICIGNGKDCIGKLYPIKLNRMHPIVVLCGSTRFKPEFESEARKLTLQGNFVINLNIFSGYDKYINLSESDISLLKDIQIDKIVLCDILYVINKDGYIGESTKQEIQFAKCLGKTIKYMVHPLLNTEITCKNDNSKHIVSNVIEFDTDEKIAGVLNDNFAVETTDGKYFHECEILYKEF